MSRARWSVAILASMVLVSGCSSADIAYDITREDVVGTWTAEGGFGTVLTLNEDGTLMATGWPIALGCDGPDVDNLEALRLVEKRDITGEWNTSVTWDYYLFLYFSPEKCMRGGLDAYVWRNANKTLDICFTIPADTDPDVLLKDQSFVFNNDPHADTEIPTCR